MAVKVYKAQLNSYNFDFELPSGLSTLSGVTTMTVEIKKPDGTILSKNLSVSSIISGTKNIKVPIVQDDLDIEGIYDYSVIDKTTPTWVYGTLLQFTVFTTVAGVSSASPAVVPFTSLKFVVNQATDLLPNAQSLAALYNASVGSSTKYIAVDSNGNLTLAPPPLTAPSGTGLLAKINGTDFTYRTATGTANRIVITNGDGVSGNPTFDIGSDVLTLTGNQVLTNKTLTSPKINLGSDATGDIYYRDSSGNLARLPVGTNTQVLTLVSGLPSWQNPTGGGSGSGTVNSGLLNQLAYYAGAGTTVSGLTLASTFGITSGTIDIVAGGITSGMLAGSIPDSKLSIISTAGKVADTALSSNVTLLGNNTTGTGSIVRATSPTLITPTFNQSANNTTAITSLRFTDTSPTGNFIDFKNAAGSSSLFKVDVLGNVTGNLFTGNGSGLTNLSAANITGTIPLGTITGLTDSNISSSAAISLSKLASVGTNNIVLVSNGSGLISASSVTTTELGLLSGVTGTLTTNAGTQTLTNKTLTSPKINVGSDATGDIYYRDSGGNFTRLAIGSAGQILQVVSGLPSWQTIATGSGTVNAGTTNQLAYYSSNGAIVNGLNLGSEFTISTGTLSVNAFGGANGSVGGSKGLVPAPSATDNTKFLKGDGTWATVATSAITSLNTLTAASQTFEKTDDTNVTLSITSSTSTHTFALGWTGTLAKSRQHVNSVYTDQANTFGAFLQKFQAGNNFNLVDSTDTTKVAKFDLSNITTATTRVINIPDADSTTVQSSSAGTNQFATGISAQGVVSYAQPSFPNLSGTLGASQDYTTGVSANTYRSVTVDTKGRVTAGTNPTTFAGYAISDTSANLASAITDETGSGLLVFNTAPTLKNILVNQNANNDDATTVKRATDTSPTGNVLKFTNAAGSTTLLNIDVTGAIRTAASVYVGSSGSIQWGDSGTAGTIRGFLGTTADGVFRFGDSSGGGSPHIILGSSSSTFVRIKRNGTALDIRLGDDSGYGNLNVGTITAGTWNGSVIGSSYGGAGTVTGILKANGTGTVSAAVAGTDYVTSLAGTANQITVSGSSGVLTASLPNAVTMPGSLTVTGDLTVNGTTFTVNSSVSTIVDPIIDIGGTTGGGAATSNDAKDRGIQFQWHNGSVAKKGFFGYDNSTGYFTFIPDATNTSEVMSGTPGTLDVTAITGSAAKWTTARTLSFTGDATGSNTVDGSGNVATALTLATVNSNTGTFGDSVTIPSITVNGKGLITAVSTNTVRSGSTSQAGILQLTDSISSTSITTAATPNSVKTSYDLANAALPKSGGTMTGKITTVASSTSTASLLLGVGSADPSAPASGDFWNNTGVLKFYNGSATKTIAFTDSNITGTATNATNVGITDQTSSSSTFYPVISPTTSGNNSLNVSSTKLSFIPFSGLLTATKTITSLLDKGGEVYNVKAYDATGDGSTNDTTAIANAISAASAGSTVYFPNGTYLTSTITISKKLNIVLDSGATIKAISGLNAALIAFNSSSTGSTLSGFGKIDGNGSTFSSGGASLGVITVSARDIILQDFNVINPYARGINIWAGGCTVNGVKVYNSPQISIMAEAASANETDISILNCLIDKTGLLNSAVLDGGIKVHSDGSGLFSFTRIKIGNNTVLFPSGVTDTDSIGIEVWAANSSTRADYAVIANNIISGGYMGISVSLGNHASVTNNIVTNAQNYGIELASSSYSSVTGNTINGNAVTSRGIVLSGSSASTFVTISGNAIKDTTNAGVYSGAANKSNISNNTIYVNAAGSGIYIAGGTEIATNGNTIDANGVASTYGIFFDNVPYCSATGNFIKGTTFSALRLYANTAITINYNFTGNWMNISGGGTIDKTLSGGAATASGVKESGNLYSSGTQADIFGRYTITSTATAARSVSYPDAGGTIVLDTAPQTLTNKTLTSPIINLGSDATGDIYYRNSGGNFTRLGIGSPGQILQVTSGLPAWQTIATGGGTVNSGGLNELAYYSSAGSSVSGLMLDTVFGISGGKLIINDFGGANGIVAGSRGIVPQPGATDNVNFLCGDGTWKAVTRVTTAAGTANQVLVNSGTSATSGAITLSLPQDVATTSAVRFGALGLGIAAPSAGLAITGKTISTDADGTIGGADIAFSITKADTNTRTFSGLRIKPTLNATAPNANTTVDILQIDTVNTNTTGISVNLIDAMYGGVSKFTVNSAGAITAGTLATSQLTGTISNGQLANSSLTVTAGTGLSGGGSVSLGGSVTLNNAGVTSITGTANQITASGSTGAVTLSLPQDITTTSNVTFNNLTVSGNLTVNGTTTAVNSTVTTVVDPIIDIGGGTNGAAPTSNDSKDRGILFQWHNGSVAKKGFFGYDNSTGFFTFVPDATNTSEVISGTTGVLDVARITGSAATLTTARSIGLTGDATGSANFDGSAGISISTTLATVNSNAGSFGDSITIPAITVNGKGLITAVSTNTVRTGSTSQTGVLQLTDSISSTSTTTAATPNSVKTAYDLANAALPKSGGTMTGKITTVAASTSTASILLGVGSADPTTPVSGDFWNNTGVLKFYNGSATKTIAFTDSDITGTATNATNVAVTDDTSTNSTYYPTFVTATSGNTGIKLSSTKLTYNPSTGVLSATQFTGSGAGLTSIPNSALTNSSLTVTAGTGLSGGGSVSLGGTVTLTNAGVTSLTGTTNRVTVSASTGSVTLNGPQDIHTSATPQFAGLGLGTASPTAGISVTGKTLTTDADGTVVAANFTGTINPPTSNTTAVNYPVVKIKPTLNSNTGVTSKTIDLLQLDTTNTNTTGLTVNLINALYGGVGKFVVDSTGAITTGSIAASKISGLTAGRVPIVATSNVLSDNANFLWDNTNSRLSVGTTSTSGTVNIDANSSSVPALIVRGNAAANQDILQIVDGNGNIKSRFSQSGDLYNFSRMYNTYCDIYTGFSVANNAAYYFSSTTSSTSNRDVSLMWNASGVIEINNTSANTFRDLKLRDIYITGSSSTPNTNNFKVTGTATSARTVTIPDTSFTVAGRDVAQTFSALQTYTQSLSATSGTSRDILVNTTFNPTSGTSVFQSVEISPTINQTGGANGITRGLYFAPTLTAAADFRAIDIANGVGYAIYQSNTNAVSLFTGVVNITKASNSSFGSLNLGSASAANGQIRFYNANTGTGQATVGFDSTALAGDFSIVSGGGSGIIRFVTGTTEQARFTNGSTGVLQLGNGTTDTGIARNAAGTVEINTGTAGSFGSLKVQSIYSAGLTSGRVPFITTNGQLTDCAQLFWDGTKELKIGDGTSAYNTRLVFNTAAGNLSFIQANRNAVSRWQLRIGNNVSETGSNAGTDFDLLAFDDTGVQIDTPLSIPRVSGGVISFGSRPIKTSSLTSTRIPYSTTGGQLTDTASLVWDNANTELKVLRKFRAGDSSNTGVFTADGPATTTRLFQFATAGVNRWQLQTNGASESGSNAGSNFVLVAYDDAGSSIDNVISIVRASGGAMTIVRPITASALVTASAGITSANNITLNPYGTSAGNTSAIKFSELAANGSNIVGFKAPDNISSDVIWTLPSADATTSGDVLTSNASGTLSFKKTKYFVSQGLTANVAATITHNMNLGTPKAVVVMVTDDSTGTQIFVKMSNYTANSIDITSGESVTTANIVIIG